MGFNSVFKGLIENFCDPSVTCGYGFFSVPDKKNTAIKIIPH